MFLGWSQAQLKGLALKVQSHDIGGLPSSAINYREIKKKHSTLERALDWETGELGSKYDPHTK